MPRQPVHSGKVRRDQFKMPDGSDDIAEWATALLREQSDSLDAAELAAALFPEPTSVGGDDANRAKFMAAVGASRARQRALIDEAISGKRRMSRGLAIRYLRHLGLGGWKRDRPSREEPKEGLAEQLEREIREEKRPADDLDHRAIVLGIDDAPGAHPGEVLHKRFMEPRGLDARALAKAIRVSPTLISDLIAEKVAITRGLAVRLADHFHTKREYWFDLQAAHDALIPASIAQLCYEADEGTIAPDDAERLMAAFCYWVEQRRPVPPSLLDHIGRAFREYLNGEGRSLDRAPGLVRALGLVRARGKPSLDEATLLTIAAEVLRSRLAGKSYEDAVAEASAVFGWAESVISKAWATHKDHVVEILRVERAAEGGEWGKDEHERLLKIINASHPQKATNKRE